MAAPLFLGLYGNDNKDGGQIKTEILYLKRYSQLLEKLISMLACCRSNMLDC